MQRNEKKKKTGRISLDFSKKYFDAHEKNFAQKYTTAYNDGHYCKPTMPKYNTANGLTSFCINYLNWDGHFAERTNNMGTPVKKKIPKFNIFTMKVELLDGGIEWRKGNGTKGTSDIKGHYKSEKYPFPIPIYIEIKIGADKLSADQIAYKAKVEATGAKYEVVKSVDDFFNFIDYLKNL